jgi:hypothetical protein
MVKILVSFALIVFSNDAIESERFFFVRMLSVAIDSCPAPPPNQASSNNNNPMLGPPQQRPRPGMGNYQNKEQHQNDLAALFNAFT